MMVTGGLSRVLLGRILYLAISIVVLFYMMCCCDAISIRETDIDTNSHSY